MDRGNNAEVVKRVLSKRSWLFEATTLSTVNIRWKQSSRDFNYNQLGSSTMGMQRKISINHLEYHSEISNKIKLFQNLVLYTKRMKENLSDFFPVTYLINLDS